MQELTNGYPNIQEICEWLPFRLEDLLYYSDYIVNGQQCALKSSTIDTILLFICWMADRTNGYKIPFSPQYFLSLKYQEFNKFRQENMSRVTKVPATKPLLGHNTKSKLDSLPLLIGLYDESVCESAEENLLHLKELKSIQLFVGATTNLFELPKPTKTFTPNQPWEGFCLRTNKTNIEDPKKVKVVNPNQHSTICNCEPKPSFVFDTCNPQCQTVHSPDICSSPEKSSQDVDESHLSASTSTTTNLNETCSLDTSCDHLLHLDSPSLPSELQDNSIVESTEPESVPDFEDLLQLDSTSVSSQGTSSIEIEFVSESEGQLDNASLLPTDIFLEHHDYDLFLLNQEIETPSDSLNHQNTHVCEKARSR